MIVWAGEVTWQQAAELRERLFDEIEDTRPESRRCPTRHEDRSHRCGAPDRCEPSGQGDRAPAQPARRERARERWTHPNEADQRVHHDQAPMLPLVSPTATTDW